MSIRTMIVVAAMLLGIAAILASVGGPAAVASYHHAYEVFVTYGEAEGRAAWLPLTTDGMLVAALVVMYSRRWARQRIGFVPWLAFGVGFIGTIAANLASADVLGAASVGEGIGRLAAAVWAPISFAVTLELVAVMLGRVRDYVARQRAAVDTSWPSTPYVPVVPRPAEPEQRDAPERVPAPADPVTRPDRQDVPARPARKRPARPAASRQDASRTSRKTDQDDQDALSWIERQWDRDGRPPTVKATREYAGGGNSRASRLIGVVRDARPAVRPVPAQVEQDQDAAS